MNATQKKMAKKILDTIDGPNFDLWYKGKFEDYIGDSNPKYNGGQTEETVLSDIVKLFRL